MSDAVFEPKTTDMRPQWTPRIAILLAELKKSPSILRLSYLADVEDPALAQRRLDRVKREITAQWKEASGDFVLAIEIEIYWRRGAPPDRRRLSND
jgi:large repetitive protein